MPKSDFVVSHFASYPLVMRRARLSYVLQHLLTDFDMKEGKRQDLTPLLRATAQHECYVMR